MSTNVLPSPQVDVIVPVYRGRDATIRCLSSVLAHAQETPHAVQVMDDASPETDLRDYLDGLAVQGRILLHRSERNTGFVATVNRGMRLNPDRDVLLLNSDTEVSGNWLDRLRAAAVSSPDIATVTPFSNNATICSYPFNGWASGIPGSLGLARLDRLAAEVNAGALVDVPTGVGCCMFVRRAALDAVGYFDEARFGRGYGEENDFCLRAGKRGLRNVLLPGVFVFHEGGVSFSAERATLQENARRQLLALHPEYAGLVNAFENEDAAGLYRLRLDHARIVAESGELREVATERRAAFEAQRSRTADEVVPPYQMHIDELARLIDRERGEFRNERERLAGNIAELEREITELRGGLANAEQWVEIRLDELERERMAREAAESLANSRGERLDRLQRSWLGVLAERWLAWRDARATHEVR